MIGGASLDVGDDRSLQFEILEDGLDDQIGPCHVPSQGGGGVGEGHHGAGGQILLVGGHASPLDLLGPIAVHVAQTPPHGLVVPVLEHDGVPLFGRHLGDARPHESRPHHAHVLHLLHRPLVDGEIVLLHLGHALEYSDESVALGGGGQFGERLALELVLVVPRRVVQAVLDAVDDGAGGRVVPPRVLGHHLLHLLPHGVPSHGSILDGPVHPTLLLGLGRLDGSVR
mmetsp:Transcript_30536/g.91226  ORF Transcript_30536/g.91226 Transcript_30536/m.91226 type:complete len:227 (-) Transcript_30536:995-1675(-)